jgi:hypothetical protein
VTGLAVLSSFSIQRYEFFHKSRCVGCARDSAAKQSCRAALDRAGGGTRPYVVRGATIAGPSRLRFVSIWSGWQSFNEPQGLKHILLNGTMRRG